MTSYDGPSRYTGKTTAALLLMGLLASGAHASSPGSGEASDPPIASPTQFYFYVSLGDDERRVHTHGQSDGFDHTQDGQPRRFMILREDIVQYNGERYVVVQRGFPDERSLDVMVPGRIEISSTDEDGDLEKSSVLPVSEREREGLEAKIEEERFIGKVHYGN